KPKAKISRPLSGQSISADSYFVRGLYQDDIKIARVELFVDGELHTTTEKSPFALRLKMIKLKPGHHLLKTIAYDADGNIGVSNVVKITKKKA
ncbi:MAG: hypothetical protein GYA55_10850, partial [SAR324 cluster bacterium]|nr:hypothetical protein [SAR324 cluster bacterium]